MGRKARHLEAPQTGCGIGNGDDERAYQCQAVSELLGVCKRTVWNLVESDPMFPAPSKMGKVTVWLQSELNAYLKSRPMTHHAEIHKLKQQGVNS